MYLLPDRLLCGLLDMQQERWQARISSEHWKEGARSPRQHAASKIACVCMGEPVLGLGSESGSMRSPCCMEQTTVGLRAMAGHASWSASWSASLRDGSAGWAALIESPQGSGPESGGACLQALTMEGAVAACEAVHSRPLHAARPCKQTLPPVRGAQGD